MNRENLGLRFFREENGKLYSVNGNHGEWKIGKWYTWNGPVKLCKSGFHYGKEPSTALQHRQGCILALVEVSKEMDSDGKKFATNRMRVLKVYGVETLAIIADCYAIHADAAAASADAAATTADYAAYAADAADFADYAADFADYAAYTASYTASYAAYAAYTASYAAAAAADIEIWHEVL